jgi:hypothetical protein
MKRYIITYTREFEAIVETATIENAQILANATIEAMPKSGSPKLISIYEEGKHPKNAPKLLTQDTTPVAPQPPATLADGLRAKMRSLTDGPEAA